MADLSNKFDRLYDHERALMLKQEAASELFETLLWVRENYASGSTTEINRRIDSALRKARGETASHVAGGVNG
jgi:hypothetical protein